MAKKQLAQVTWYEEITSLSPYVGYRKQVSAVADEPARRAASRQTYCKQKWMLGVINVRPN